MNQMSLNNAILSFAFSGVFAPHRTIGRSSPSPAPVRSRGSDAESARILLFKGK